MEPPTPLENDARNRCVGCGPANPVGLRLSFARHGDEVRTRFEATPEREGWPQRLHSGLLYLALLETANWTLHGLTGRVGIPVRTGALEARRWVATGETLTLRGTLAHRDERTARVVAEAVDASGAHVARLERAYDLPEREEFLRRMGYERVPPEFEGVL